MCQPPVAETNVAETQFGRTTKSGTLPILRPGNRVLLRFSKKGAFSDPIGPASKLRAAFVDFTAIDRNRGWSADPQPNPIAIDCHDRDSDVAVDHDFFAETSCENEHDRSSVSDGGDSD
jgi:hypothetical protein